MPTITCFSTAAFHLPEGTATNATQLRRNGGASQPLNNQALIPMHQTFHDFTTSTRGRGFYELTPEVTAWIRNQDLKNGLLTLHLRHTSASLLIQENADLEVQRDLERFFSRLVPDGDPMFRHRLEGNDDMPAHIRTALTAVNLSIPVSGGCMALGTWQGIYLWEHRTVRHTRQIAAHFIGE